MSASTVQIEEALLDVRRAYRLVHDYQRMVLDAVNHIGQQLGLTYAGGWPRFSDPSPQRGRGDLDYWAWDWLNLFLYNFHFTRPLPAGKVLSVSILLISDTGYFHLPDKPSIDPLGADFAPAENSATKIGFIMTAKTWPHPGFMERNAEMKVFVESGGQLPPEYAAQGVVAKCYSLARLATEENTAALIDELIAFASQSGIPLSRVAKL